MRLQRRDEEIAANYTGATFNLTGDDGAVCFEGVDSFKYLGSVLYRSDEDWPAVLRNIERVRQVWGRLGKLLRREGADLIVPEKFYQAVVQAVIIFGAGKWVLTATMLQKLEGVNVGFLSQVTGMLAPKLGVYTWKK